MKNILVVIFSCFLLSTLNCASTKKIDISGNWILTEDVIAPDCGGNKTETFPIEISQQGDSVTSVDKARDWTRTGKISGNVMSIPESVPEFFKGKLKVSPYDLTVSEDANTMTGKTSWIWDNGVCGGNTNLTYKRKNNVYAEDVNQELIHAARAGDMSKVNSCLAKGADVNAKDSVGMTALGCASKSGHLSTVEALVAGGADINTHYDPFGASALITAAYFNRPEILKFLISNGADVNAKNYSGQTALYFSKANDLTAIQQILKEAGAKE